jgi:hypothetical protein
MPIRGNIYIYIINFKDFYRTAITLKRVHGTITLFTMKNIWAICDSFRNYPRKEQGIDIDRHSQGAMLTQNAHNCGSLIVHIIYDEQPHPLQSVLTTARNVFWRSAQISSDSRIKIHNVTGRSSCMKAERAYYRMLLLYTCFLIKRSEPWQSESAWGPKPLQSTQDVGSWIGYRRLCY